MFLLVLSWNDLIEVDVATQNGVNQESNEGKLRYLINLGFLTDEMIFNSL